MMRNFILAGTTLILGSCGEFSVPKNQMGAVSKMAPNSWSSTKYGQGGVDRAWVKRFNSSQLERLVMEAVTRNPDMRVAAERVKQAEQTAYLAGATGRLKSSASFTGDRDKRVFVGFPFGGSSTSTTYGVNWMVNWEPDLWGKVRAGVEASVADAQAVALQRKSAESSLAARVCKAWFALCEANEQYLLSAEGHVARVKVMESIRSKFELALTGEGGSASQLRIAETDVATSLAVKAQREGEVDSAKRQLEVLIGRYPSGVIGARMDLPNLPAKPPAGLPSELLMRRPDILAAERQFTSATRRIQEAHLAKYPSFKLTASTGTVSDSLTKVLSSSNGIWSIGSNISQNILTGGQIKGELKIRNSKEREAVANLQGTILKAFSEVEAALATDRWLDKRIVEMRKALKLAEEATEAAEQDLADGNADALTVLRAQTQRIDIASNVVLMRRLQLDNRVNLHLALGGEFRSTGK